jgi:hypothetical protein
VLQITQIDLEPIENASRLMCGDHHHVDKLEECFRAKVSKWTAESAQAMKKHSILRGVLFFTPCPFNVSHSASVNDRCALNA